LPLSLVLDPPRVDDDPDRDPEELEEPDDDGRRESVGNEGNEDGPVRFSPPPEDVEPPPASPDPPPEDPPDDPDEPLVRGIAV
jgi:hypothetical protein